MENELDKMLDSVGTGRHNIIVLLTSSLIHLAGLLDLLGFCLIVPAASCDLNLGLLEISVLTSIPLAGYLFALLWGYYADTYGRRRAILLAASMGSIFAFSTSFSSSFKMMLLLKFIGCCFSTGSITLSIIYLGECTGNKHRNKYIFILNSFSMICDLVLYGLAYIILSFDFKMPILWLSITYRPWRLLVQVMASLLGVGALGIFLLHETPKFLIDKGETAKLTNVLKTSYKIDGINQEFLIKPLITRSTENRIRVNFWNSLLKQTAMIFRPPLLWRTMQLFFLLAVCVCTNNVFFVWFPTMVNLLFTSQNNNSEEFNFCQTLITNATVTDFDEQTCDNPISTTTLQSGMLASLLLTVFNLGMAKLASWRKVMLIGCLILSGVSVLLVNLIRQPVISIIFLVLVQITGVCLGNVLSYFIDVYPTSCRGLGTSLGMTFARIVSLSGVNLVGATMMEYCSITFYGWAVFIFCGVATAFILPSDNTEGKCLVSGKY